MIDNRRKGILVAFDGPNGAGKTTLIEALKKKLETNGYNVCVTNEPTATELGNYVRKFSETHKGISLACLVAGDRYEHIKNEIIPELENGKIVITDRYILSSLILQGIDGVDAEFVLNINSNIIKPDLHIAVYADQKELQERLGKRAALTRFEKSNQSNDELIYMENGIKILIDKGIEVVEIHNNGDIEENIKTITLQVINKWRDHEKIYST